MSERSPLPRLQSKPAVQSSDHPAKPGAQMDPANRLYYARAYEGRGSGAERAIESAVSIRQPRSG
jgi:hypothetical protein